MKTETVQRIEGRDKVIVETYLTPSAIPTGMCLLKIRDAKVPVGHASICMPNPVYNDPQGLGMLDMDVLANLLRANREYIYNTKRFDLDTYRFVRIIDKTMEDPPRREFILLTEDADLRSYMPGLTDRPRSVEIDLTQTGDDND